MNARRKREKTAGGQPRPTSTSGELGESETAALAAAGGSRRGTPPPAEEGELTGILPPAFTDPRRRDLLPFLDSLYAGGVALGVARFIEGFERVSNESTTARIASPVLSFATAGLALATALLFVLDDWRHARAVDADYGLRIDPKKGAWRFWLDAAAAVTGFFLVSYSFVNPVRYLVFLVLLFSLGGLWSWAIHDEIRAFIRKEKRFPPNSLGITLGRAKRLEGLASYKADYRTAFVSRSHWLVVVGVGMVASFLSWGKYAGRLEPERWERLHLENVVSWLNIGAATLLPASIFVVLKATHHSLRKTWFEKFHDDAGE